MLGSQVSRLAIPLMAVLVLRADEQQMGFLGAATNLPFLFFGLLAGVFTDRIRRRPLLIVVNIGSGLLIGSIPVAAMLGYASMPQLYFVAFGMGLGDVVGIAAYQAFIPSLVGRRRLVDANSKLEISSSSCCRRGRRGFVFRRSRRLNSDQETRSSARSRDAIVFSEADPRGSCGRLAGPAAPADHGVRRNA